MQTGKKTDAQIQQDVIRELKWDPRVEETEVGVEVDAVGGADVLVPQPERDGRGVDAVTEQVHGAGVTKRMWRDVLGSQ